MNNNYPTSVTELNLDSISISPEIVAAVKRFAASKPYRGAAQDRIQKFSAAIIDISRAAGVEPPHLNFSPDERKDSGCSCFCPGTRTITLVGRQSVITALHEVAHMLFGPSEYTACTWSLRLFRDCFPKSWAKLRFTGHMGYR